MYVTTSVIKGMDLAEHDVLWHPSCVVYLEASRWMNNI